MNVCQQDLNLLFKIQDIDLNIVKQTSELENLPQRQTILDCRKKLEELNAKLEKIIALKKESQKKLTKIEDEDASLLKKENGIQAAIEAAAGDFRNAEARTKELDGIFKRRNTLSQDLTSVKTELSKISSLENQVNSAISDLEVQENSAVESFKSQGGALQNEIAKDKAQREALLDMLNLEVAKMYKQTSALFDTVFIANLDSNKCSVCRFNFDTGKLLSLKEEAPLTKCPSCKRLLLIEDK